MAVAAKVRLKDTRWWPPPKPLTLLLFLTTAAAFWSGSLAQVVRRVEARGQRPTCQVSPQWTARPVDPEDGSLGPSVNPMEGARGKVVLLALMDASSQHYRDQAHKLQSLESYFQAIGMNDLIFILVNSAEARDQLADLLPEQATVTAMQEDASERIWTKLGGRKGDLFLYDRCGRLTYAIPFPLSIIHPRQQLVESSVISTYLDDLCGQRTCQGEAAPEDSADTELVNSTHSTLVDVTQVVNDTEEVAMPEDLSSDDNSTEQMLPFPDYLVDLSTDQNRNDTNISNWWPENEQETKFQQELPEVKAEVSGTAEPAPVLSGLWSLYRKVLKYVPWATKEEKKTDRNLNSVQKFVDQEASGTPAAVAAPNTTRKLELEEEEGELHPCRDMPRGTCQAWSGKRVAHARVCCNLHACNGTAQYLQKHCRHYPKQRCKKVETVLRCCQGNESDQGMESSNSSGSSATSSPSPVKS